LEILYKQRTCCKKACTSGGMFSIQDPYPASS
jgi:hypothetical protein